MPRYIIERVWDPMEEEEIATKGALSKRILTEERQFSQVKWEHSHVVYGRGRSAEVLLRLFLARHETHTGARGDAW